MTGAFRAQLAKKEFGERACGRASRSFAGGSALQNVAGIVKIKFLSARKVGVTRPRRKQPSLMVGGFGGGLNGQNFLPISPVAIFDPQGHGRPDGFPVPHAGKNVGSALLDFLAPTAAVTELAPGKLTIDEFQVHSQGGREPGN